MNLGDITIFTPELHGHTVELVRPVASGAE